MRDEDCVGFLQSHLPRLNLRWAGYRKVRRTVCTRLRRRLRELGLESLEAYAALLERDASEWRRFEGCCRIPISRFYRDRAVFDTLARRVLPDLARRAVVRGDGRVCCWSAGCASGEEAYSVRIAWSRHAERAHPGVHISVVATDAERAMLRRAEQARYGKGSLKDLPPGVLAQAFLSENGGYRLREEFKQGVRFVAHDIRSEMPAEPVDLILCRNLVFTYFDEALQVRVLSHLDGRLRTGGTSLSALTSGYRRGRRDLSRATDPCRSSESRGSRAAFNRMAAARWGRGQWWTQRSQDQRRQYR